MRQKQVADASERMHSGEMHRHLKPTLESDCWAMPPQHWQYVQAMFEGLKQHLCLESLPRLRGPRDEETAAHMETSVMMLGAAARC